MELVQIYEGRITGRREILRSEIELLENSALIYVPESEMGEFLGLSEHPHNVQGINGVHSVKHLKHIERQVKAGLEQEKKRNEMCRAFCAEARKRNVSFSSMHSCLAKIINGNRLNDIEKKASNFLGEPETFWNPLKYGLDYNFFRNNYEQIQRSMG